MMVHFGDIILICLLLCWFTNHLEARHTIEKHQHHLHQIGTTHDTRLAEVLLRSKPTNVGSRGRGRGRGRGGSRGHRNRWPAGGGGGHGGQIANFPIDVWDPSQGIYEQPSTPQPRPETTVRPNANINNPNLQSANQGQNLNDFEIGHWDMEQQLSSVQPVPISTSEDYHDPNALILTFYWPTSYHNPHWIIHSLRYWNRRPNDAHVIHNGALFSRHLNDHLASTLRKCWPTINPSYDIDHRKPRSLQMKNFWEYQWHKHGIQTGIPLERYFDIGCDLWKRLPVEEWLYKADILPSHDTLYTAKEMDQAIMKHGHLPNLNYFTLHCRRHTATYQLLYEIKFYLTADGSRLRVCPGGHQQGAAYRCSEPYRKLVYCTDHEKIQYRYSGL